MLMAFLEGSNPFEYVLHHNMDAPLFSAVAITKFTANMLLSAAILIGLVLITNKRSMVPSGFLRNTFEGLYTFIRDDMVYPAMGEKDGRAMMPFFLTLFSFILTMNLVGMLPLPVIGGAATSQLSLTVVLAASVLLLSIGMGIAKTGIGGFFGHFMPSGVPGAILPLIVVIEFFGFFVKHAVLAVRLMANMLGGHLVVGAFIGMIVLFKSYAMAGFSVPMMVFVNLLEILVAFIQAYVFTLLSAMFIGGTMHPDH
jgi:F-type H+-transporting ATPase subunit a